MKPILVSFVLFLSLSLQAQKRFSLLLDNNIGLLQLQERRFDALTNKSSLTPRYGLGVSAMVSLFRTNLELGLGGLYSWATIPIFLGGSPMLEGSKDGLPTVNINHNHWEARLFIQCPFIDQKKIQIGGLLGIDIGIPDFINRIGNTSKGSLNVVRDGTSIQFDYSIFLSNMRNSFAIRSGLTTTILLSKQVSLNLVLAYRLGLIQSVGLLYIGDIWVDNAAEPRKTSFEKFTSNSGAFLDIGLKWSF